MPDKYFLNKEQVERIKRMLGAFETGTLTQSFQPQKVYKKDPLNSFLVKTDEDIPALEIEEGEEEDTYTPGTGDAKIWKGTSPEVDPPEIIENPYDEIFTVWNFSNKSIPSGRICQVLREPFSGKFFIVPPSDETFKVELKDDYLDEGGSAEVYLLDYETWERKDPEEIVTIQTVFPNSNCELAGVHIKGDYVSAIKEGDTYYAVGIGHLYTRGSATAAGEAGSTSTAEWVGSEELDDFIIGYCHNDFADNDILSCHWSRSQRQWECGKFGYGELGCGLEYDAEEDKLQIKLSDIAGEGLEVVAGEGEDCDTLAVDIELIGGCGIDVNEYTIGVDLTEIVVEGNGLKFIDNTPPACDQVEFSVSCGLVDDGSGNLEVDLPVLVNEGNGLTIAAGETCDAIEMSVSCGLIDDGSGNLQVDFATAAGTGLIVEAGEECDALAVDCDYVVQCVEDALEDPESPLYTVLVNFFTSNTTIINAYCDECENRLTCEDTEGLPVFRYNGSSWILVNPCDCDDPDEVPTAPEEAGESGEYLAGTCEDFDCEYTGGMPIWECVDGEWELFDPCDTCETCTAEPPDIDPCEEGGYGEGTITPDELDCEDCDDAPIYSWVGSAWTIVNDCECEDTLVEPDGDGTIDGEYQCGTCESEDPDEVCDDQPAGSATTYGSETYNWSPSGGGGSAAMAPIGTPVQTNFLGPQNFGYMIPTGSTINGITLRYTVSGTGVSKENAVYLTKTGTNAGDNKSDGTNWETSATVRTRGGPSDLWGQTWTAAEINNSIMGPTFRVETIDGSTSGSPTVSNVELEVCYTPPCDVCGQSTYTLTASMFTDTCGDCVNFSSGGNISLAGSCGAGWSGGGHFVCSVTIDWLLTKAGSVWTLVARNQSSPSTIYATYTFTGTWDCDTSDFNAFTFVSAANDWCTWSTAIIQVKASM